MTELLKSNPWLWALSFVVGGLVAALVTELVVIRTLRALAARTKNDIDDRVISTLERPVFLSVILIGLAAGVRELGLISSGYISLESANERMILSVIESVATVLWCNAAWKVGITFLDAWSRRGQGVVQRQTLPLFRIMWIVTTVGTGIYILLLIWDIDASGWLASAGVLGIVIGLAAKDSLANLFAGLFILADAPFRLGDYIILESGIRGKVTHVGVRSTRILTLDAVEVTVPNSIIGNSTIVNETAGPAKTRHRVIVSCSYDSNADHVREVLLSVVEGVEHVETHPAAQVRFTSFGDSGLNFELLFWISDGSYRDIIIDKLNVRVHKAFAAADIEIPYPKRDLYIRDGGAPVLTSQG